MYAYDPMAPNILLTKFTVWSKPCRGTVTGVTIDAINTGSAILTWTTGTFINIYIDREKLEKRVNDKDIGRQFMHGKNVEFGNLIPWKCSLLEGNIWNFEGKCTI